MEFFALISWTNPYRKQGFMLLGSNLPLFLNFKITFCKQTELYRTLSDIVVWGVWSGSALFALSVLIWLQSGRYGYIKEPSLWDISFK